MTAGLWCLEGLTPKLYKHLAAMGANWPRAWPTPRARPGAGPDQRFGSLLTVFFTDQARPRLRRRR
jgi:hypothetical protein